MIKAIIFDFNGVIADDEHLHLELFQKVVAEEGMKLTEADYYEKNYLGMDDRGCLSAVYRAHGRQIEDSTLQALIERKARYYQEAVRERLLLFPGAVDFVRHAAKELPLAIVSGALRREIDLILDSASIRDCFRVIVSAEDVRQGKPDPEGFVRALEALKAGMTDPLRPDDCLVIEDSPFGIQAAKQAGMRCMAITNSYPEDKLGRSDHIIRSLEGLTVESLRNALPGSILAYCPDLFFTSKISETGRHLGISVQTASSIDQLHDQAGQSRHAVILVDLGGNGVNYPEAIRRLKEISPQTPILAYGSHVDRGLREAAKAAGCEEVLVRSEFTKRLPEILERYTQGKKR